MFILDVVVRRFIGTKMLFYYDHMSAAVGSGYVFGSFACLSVEYLYWESTDNAIKDLLFVCIVVYCQLHNRGCFHGLHGIHNRHLCVGIRNGYKCTRVLPDRISFEQKYWSLGSMGILGRGYMRSKLIDDTYACFRRPVRVG